VWPLTDGRPQGGHVTRAVSLYDVDQELSAADARRLAAALLNAADELDGLAK
jgi:hypothetical protein